MASQTGKTTHAYYILSNTYSLIMGYSIFKFIMSENMPPKYRVFQAMILVYFVLEQPLYELL